jgi:hypothetical protein
VGREARALQHVLDARRGEVLDQAALELDFRALMPEGARVKVPVTLADFELLGRHVDADDAARRADEGAYQERVAACAAAEIEHGRALERERNG